MATFHKWNKLTWNQSRCDSERDKKSQMLRDSSSLSFETHFMVQWNQRISLFHGFKVILEEIHYALKNPEIHFKTGKKDYRKETWNTPHALSPWFYLCDLNQIQLLSCSLVFPGQAFLWDIVGLLPDHCNKVNTAVKQVKWISWFLSANKGYIKHTNTILLSIMYAIALCLKNNLHLI